MPEGDTIARAARTLDGALAGRTLIRFEAPRLRGTTPRAGTKIDGVDARGKHLLVRFGDGRVLHTHMQMTGSWHVYRSGTRWRKPAHLARVVLEVDDGTVAVCFSAPVVEMLDGELRVLGSGGRRGGAVGLAALGPDLCRPDVDIDEAVRRMGTLDPATEVAVALLDQRVAAGVGNVYKSEVCFACEVDPRTPVGALDEPVRRRLLETASRQLQANLDRSRRTTFPDGLPDGIPDGLRGGLAVYGRAGRSCRRCGDRIRRIRQGPTPRSTYYCPTCQPGPDRAPVQSRPSHPEEP
jgi:endonuclease-8